MTTGKTVTAGRTVLRLFSKNLIISNCKLCEAKLFILDQKKGPKIRYQDFVPLQFFSDMAHLDARTVAGFGFLGFGRFYCSSQSWQRWGWWGWRWWASRCTSPGTPEALPSSREGNERSSGGGRRWVRVQSWWPCFLSILFWHSSLHSGKLWPNCILGVWNLFLLNRKCACGRSRSWHRRVGFHWPTGAWIFNWHRWRLRMCRSRIGLRWRARCGFLGNRCGWHSSCFGGFPAILLSLCFVLFE